MDVFEVRQQLVRDYRSFTPRSSSRGTVGCIADLTELIQYHLVLGSDTDAAADDRLSVLVCHIERMSTRPLWRAGEWMACEAVGAWVDTDLIGPDCAGIGERKVLSLLLPVGRRGLSGRVGGD